MVVPVQDFHQRALAGAILTEYCVDLAPVHVQIDVVVGENSGKPLGNSAQAQVRYSALRFERRARDAWFGQCRRFQCHRPDSPPKQCPCTN